MKPNIDFEKTLQTAIDHVESKYGLDVHWKVLPEGVAGDLDGTNIYIDPTEDKETVLYTFLHLFGHTVQWNTDQGLNALGHDRTLPIDEEMLKPILTYEQNASRLGISLLAEIGHPDYREWMSRCFYADWVFLSHLYLTAEKKPINVDWSKPVELLEPLPIPIFTPHVFENRQAFD